MEGAVQSCSHPLGSVSTHAHGIPSRSSSKGEATTQYPKELKAGHDFKVQLKSDAELWPASVWRCTFAARHNTTVNCPLHFCHSVHRDQSRTRLLITFLSSDPSKLPVLRDPGPLYCGSLQCTKQLLQPRLDSKQKVSASADGDALEQHFPSSAHDAYGSKAGSVVANTAKLLKIFNWHVARCTLCYRTGRTHLFSRLTDSCYQNKFAPNVTHQPTYGLRFF